MGAILNKNQMSINSNKKIGFYFEQTKILLIHEHLVWVQGIETETLTRSGENWYEKVWTVNNSFV